MTNKRITGSTRRARKNHARKLKLEEVFKKELNTLFNSITKQFKTHYSINGFILPREFYQEDIISALRKHYKRVAREFSKEMREEFSPKHFKLMETKQGEEDVSLRVDVALALYIIQHTRIQSELMTNTTQTNMLDSVQKANMQLEIDDVQATATSIATASAPILNKTLKSRINTIALTETQNMAEATKAIETTVTLSDQLVTPEQAVSLVLGPSIEANKEWAAILDEKTRNDHVGADGQTVSFNDPFIVGGERLRWPGDTSLGASAGNTINCRCSSLTQPFN